MIYSWNIDEGDSEERGDDNLTKLVVVGSSRCILAWRRRFERIEKDLRQTGHLCGFSPLWESMCVFNAEGRDQVFEQRGQGYFFSSSLFNLMTDWALLIGSPYGDGGVGAGRLGLGLGLEGGVIGVKTGRETVGGWGRTPKSRGWGVGGDMNWCPGKLVLDSFGILLSFSDPSVKSRSSTSASSSTSSLFLFFFWIESGCSIVGREEMTFSTRLLVKRREVEMTNNHLLGGDTGLPSRL